MLLGSRCSHGEYGEEATLLPRESREAGAGKWTSSSWRSGIWQMSVLHTEPPPTPCPLNSSHALAPGTRQKE